VVAIRPEKLSQSLGFLYVALSYCVFFWRTFRRNPGNRLVECGVFAISSFLLLMILSRFVELPDWVAGFFLLLIFLLCVSTLFFLAQRMWRAVHHRKTTKSRPGSWPLEHPR